MPSTVLVGLGLAGAALALWQLVQRRRTNARRDRDVQIVVEAPTYGSAPDDAPSETLSIATDFASDRQDRKLKLSEPASRSEPVPSRSPKARSAQVAPSAQPITDPFLARMGEQARETRVPRPLPSRKLRHKPMRPMRPPVPLFTPPVEGRRFRMTYATRWGEVTDRRIRFKRSYVRDGEVYVDAFCYMRQEDRTFRADRMLTLIDTGSGAKIVNPLHHFQSAVE